MGSEYIAIVVLILVGLYWINQPITGIITDVNRSANTFDVVISDGILGHTGTGYVNISNPQFVTAYKNMSIGDHFKANDDVIYEVNGKWLYHGN